MCTIDEVIHHFFSIIFMVFWKSEFWRIECFPPVVPSANKNFRLGFKFWILYFRWRWWQQQQDNNNPWTRFACFVIRKFRSFVHLSVCLFACFFVHLLVYLLVLFLYLYVCLFFCLLINSFVCCHIHLFLNFFIRSFSCEFVCFFSLFVRLLVRSFNCLFVSFFLSFVCLFVRSPSYFLETMFEHPKSLHETISYLATTKKCINKIPLSLFSSVFCSTFG